MAKKDDVRFVLSADDSDLQKKIKNVRNNIDGLGNISLTAVTAAFTGLAAGAAATGVALYQAGQNARELDNLRRLANLSVEEFQNLTYATEQYGVSGEKMADISKDVADKLGDFIATGAGPFSDFFEQVGSKIDITAESLQGLSGPDALIAVKKAMDDANISAEEQIFYLESLASDTSLLIPLLEDGGRALKEEAEQARALGLALSGVEVENLKEAQQQITKMGAILNALKDKTLAYLAPAFSGLMDTIIDTFAAGEGGVSSIAQAIAGKLVGSLGVALEVMRFFHNAWLGIKLVGVGTVDAIAMAMNLYFEKMRSFMFILDGAFKMAVKIGAMDANPLDGIATALEDFKFSSRSVTKDVLADIQSTNDKYDIMGRKISEVKTEIESLGPAAKSSQGEATEAIQGTTGAIDANTNAVLKNKAANNDLNAAVFAHIATLNAVANAKDGYTDRWLLKDQAMKASMEDVKNKQVETSGIMETVVTGMSENMRGVFTSVVGEGLRGEFDSIGSAFEALTGRMLDSFLGMAAEMASKKLFDSVLSMVPGGSFISEIPIVGDVIGGIGDFISDIFATGGVPGGDGLTAHKNTVVSKPTIFPFAKGIGLMGEAGSEAIVPLARNPRTGNLGVEAMGGGSGVVNLTLPIYLGGREVERFFIKIADGHIVARNRRGVDPFQMAVAA